MRIRNVFGACLLAFAAPVAGGEGEGLGTMNQKPITTSSFAARLDYVEADEKAALRERAKSFGRYYAEIRHYLEDGTHWYAHRGDLVIDGDFDNDMLLVVEGDLTIRGTYNDDRSGAGHLLVLGDVRAENVLSGNAFCATGSLYAAGLVLATYNDHPFEVSGPVLAARGLVLVDKSGTLPGRRIVEFSSTEGEDDDPLDEHLAPAMLQWLDEDYDEISADKGRKLRRSGAEVHVQIAGWDEACTQVYARRAFVRAYALPADPDDDALRLALLQPGAPAAVFEQAVAREALLYDVALAPAAPAALLTELAERSADGERDPRVAFAVASHPRTPPAVLAALAAHDADTVRAAGALQDTQQPAAAAGAALSLDERHQQLLDPAREVREAALRGSHSWLRFSFIETHADRFAGDESSALRRATARLSRQPDVLDRLSRDQDEKVRRAVGENLATPPDVLAAMAERLADSEDDGDGLGMSPRESAANDLMENPLLPAAAFEHIARFYPRAYHMEAHPDLPLDLFLSYESFEGLLRHQPALLPPLLPGLCRPPSRDSSPAF